MEAPAAIVNVVCSESVSGCSCPWQLKQLNWLNEEKPPWQVLQSAACGPVVIGNLWFARVIGELTVEAPGWHASKASSGRQNRKLAAVEVMGLLHGKELLRRFDADTDGTSAGRHYQFRGRWFRQLQRPSRNRKGASRCGRTAMRRGVRGSNSAREIFQKRSEEGWLRPVRIDAWRPGHQFSAPTVQWSIAVVIPRYGST